MTARLGDGYLPPYARDDLTDRCVTWSPVVTGKSLLLEAAECFIARGRTAEQSVPVKGLIRLSTGVGKTLSSMVLIAEVAEQRRKMTTVVKSRHELMEELKAQYTGFGVAKSLTEAVGLRLVPEPYVPRKLRARTTPVAEYRALCRRAVEWEKSGRDQEHREVAGDRRVRNPAARRAVIIRSKGRCENPECLLPDLPYRTKAGEPLLEVDHVDDHASGGRDHPQAMIALCPNCHRNKTHGLDGPELAECLRTVALRRHEEWERAPGSRSVVSML